jgi:TolA-binding protein
MKLYLVLFSATFSSLLYASEPSAFGAGNLNSNNPYGLTSSEKHIFSNQETLKNLKKSFSSSSSTISELEERISGLQSVLEGINDKSQKNKISFSQWLEKYKIDQDNNIVSSKLSDEEIAQLKLSFVSVQNDNIQLKEVISELSTLIDSINANYVSKVEFNTLVNDINSLKKSMLKEFKSINKPLKNSLDELSTAQISKKAEELYKKQRYTQSIEYYEYLIEHHYKPARAHYMIGEMNYKRKNYKKAISYFKESAARYSKASYMPNMMLHMAISMYETSDKATAEGFFDAIVMNYPDSKEAIKAKEYLTK